MSDPIVIRDALGQTAAIGHTVAFNYSGEVRIGVIVNIVPHSGYRFASEQYANTIHVRHHNGLSKVKNSKSILQLSCNLLAETKAAYS